MLNILGNAVGIGTHKGGTLLGLNSANLFVDAKESKYQNTRTRLNFELIQTHALLIIYADVVYKHLHKVEVIKNLTNVCAFIEEL